MNKKTLVLAGIITVLMMNAAFAFAQNAENATVKDHDPLKDYLRPSLTVLYIDRGEAVAGKIIDKMIQRGVSDKFNDNTISYRKLPATGQVTEAELDKLINEKVTKEVVRCWFPSYDKTEKGFNTDVIAERGLYGATDAEVLAAGASVRRQALLRDAGLKLIERSYIVIYDLYGSKAIVQENGTRYETNCNVYLYKLDWSEEVEALFYERWSDPDAIDKSTFPAKKIASFVNAPYLTPVYISNLTPNPMPDDEFFANFAGVLEGKADVYLTEANEDFKVKTSIFAMSPIRAKIGTKEGVKVDQRYFVYEIELLDGEEVAKRKGVVRATSSIVDNSQIATGDGGTTKFYQTYGKRLDEGMLMQQKPDMGVGVSVMGGSDAIVLLELSVGMWLNEFIPSLNKVKFPSATKLYMKYTQPMMGMFGEESWRSKLIGGDIETKASFVSVGLSKDFHFMRYLSLTPYVGFSALMADKETKDNAPNLATDGFEAGLNLNIAVLHNFQIILNGGYNSLKKEWYDEKGLTAAGGFRLQF
ncbi:MAG: hypothetical protein LBD53_00680 [Tannerella sp.]|jgi:hypothetical protein|nr:hypothetical protein [Tannerella sp.]